MHDAVAPEAHSAAAGVLDGRAPAARGTPAARMAPASEARSGAGALAGGAYEVLDAETRVLVAGAQARSRSAEPEPERRMPVCSTSGLEYTARRRGRRFRSARCQS
eukprot:9673223-Alexandrium_andersonii.AAC.1